LALKKQHFAEGEIPIFDEACIYKRGEYWQFRMWLPKENKPSDIWTWGAVEPASKSGGIRQGF